MEYLKQQTTELVTINSEFPEKSLRSVWSSYDKNVHKVVVPITTQSGITFTMSEITSVEVYLKFAKGAYGPFAGQVEDAEQKTVSFAVPEEVRGQTGNVTISIMIKLTGDRQIDLAQFKAVARLSKIDQDTPAIQEFYVPLFENLVESVTTDLNADVALAKSKIDQAVTETQDIAQVEQGKIQEELPKIQTELSTINADIEAQKEKFDAASIYSKAEVDSKVADLDSVKADIIEVRDELLDIKGFVGYNDTDIYGVEVDMTNKTFKRLAGSVNRTPGTGFDMIKAFGGRKRCILTDGGVVIAYYGEPGYTETGALLTAVTKGTVTYPIGTKVQVMVEQPLFYYRVSPIILDPIADGKGHHLRKGRYYVSDKPKTGFKVHPAFIVNGQVKEKIYLSAFEGSIYDTSANAYVLNDEQVADFSADLLSSIAGAKPASGLTQNLTRENLRKLSQKRGAGWQQAYAATIAATQLLFLIEYNTFNWQTALGQGATQKTDDGTTNMAEPTGGSSTLGNKSGQVANLNGINIVSYRGEENFFGNIWKSIDGMNLMANGVHALFIADHDFAEKVSTGAYKDAGFTVARTRGYVSAFGYSSEFDWLFMTSESIGNSALPVGDYFWQNYTATDDGGWRAVRLGAHWYSGAYAGGFDWSVDDWSANRSRYVSGRLVYVA